MKEAGVKCPNCGNPHLTLAVIEVAEKTYSLSGDGRWLSIPVFEASKGPGFRIASNTLRTKMVLRCHYCGQENEAVLTVKGRFSTCISLGAETSHGASIK